MSIGESGKEVQFTGRHSGRQRAHLMSSSLAKMMTPRALEVSISLLMIDHTLLIIFSRLRQNGNNECVDWMTLRDIKQEQ